MNDGGATTRDEPAAAAPDGVAAAAATPDVAIRRADRGDADAIAAVHVSSWRAAYRGLLPQDFLDGLDVEHRRDVWWRQLTEPGEVIAVLIAARGPQTLGFASLTQARDSDGDRIGEVAAIYVAPWSWGTGVGRALMDAAVTTLTQAGFAEATLWVLSGNDRALSFYRAAGWHPDGTTRTDAIGGQQVLQLRLRRSLPGRVP